VVDPDPAKGETPLLAVRQITHELETLKEDLISKIRTETTRIIGEVVNLGSSSKRRFLVLADTQQRALRLKVRIPREGRPVHLGDMVTVEGTLQLESSDSQFEIRLIGKLIENRGRSAYIRERDQCLRELLRQKRPFRQGKRPRRIAVVTNVESDGCRDFLALLANRRVATPKVFNVALASATDIARGMREAAADGADLIALVRGGGPRYELEPFESPEVAKATLDICAATIIGVGHARDKLATDPFFTYVAKTPSHAAARVANLCADRKGPKRRLRLVLIASVGFTLGWLGSPLWSALARLVWTFARG
jgi:exodeoxyribonuclease VII large subunit